MAREGLRRIANYVDERFGTGVAERVVSELEQAFKDLAARPRIGHPREDLTRDGRVLFWSVGPTLIAYRSKPDGEVILFVERGDLDWEGKLLDGL